MLPEATIVLATEAHLLEILAWLKREERETGEGFYCNREIIIKARQHGEVWCALVCSKVVGFVVQTRKTVGASIDILEVKPQCRRQGFGTMLALSTIERLFGSGAEFITVQCAPRRSEQFWRSVGFRPTNIPQRSVWDNPKLVLQRDYDNALNRTR